MSIGVNLDLTCSLFGTPLYFNCGRENYKLKNSLNDKTENIVVKNKYSLDKRFTIKFRVHPVININQ